MSPPKAPANRTDWWRHRSAGLCRENSRLWLKRLAWTGLLIFFGAEGVIRGAERFLVGSRVGRVWFLGFVGLFRRGIFGGCGLVVIFRCRDRAYRWGSAEAGILNSGCY